MAEIKHIDAFEFYYSLGSARTYDLVAQKFNKSKGTIERWGSAEGWQEEVRVRDCEQIRANRLSSIKEREKTQKELINIVNGALNVFIEKLKKGKVKVESVGDLEKLIKLRVLLDGYIDDGYEKILNSSAVRVGDQSAGATSNEEEKVVFSLVSVKKEDANEKDRDKN